MVWSRSAEHDRPRHPSAGRLDRGGGFDGGGGGGEDLFATNLGSRENKNAQQQREQLKMYVKRK